jgi:serine/threonine protein kinase
VILKLARDIARGLAEAHAAGLIHRDIKPANIWLDSKVSGRARILDFGLARLTEGTGDQHLTQSGMVLGTPAYMAPEQAEGEKLDGRADLFSLGVIVYRLCTGGHARSAAARGGQPGDATGPVRPGDVAVAQGSRGADWQREGSADGSPAT